MGISEYNFTDFKVLLVTDIATGEHFSAPGAYNFRDNVQPEIIRIQSGKSQQ
jgi:hypothetical protein